MGTVCTKTCPTCCGKVQDWCRESCGCCPCKFCKTKKVEIQSTQSTHHKEDKKAIPYGYTYIYAGDRTANNTHTTPVLEIHTWKKSEEYEHKNESSITQTVALGGIQTQRDNADRHIGPSRGVEQQTTEREEEVIVIPIESITLIKSSSEVKKGETKRTTVRLKTPPVKLSCCDKLSRWCSKTFCCCCADSKTQVHKEPELITTTVANQEADRKILITIEYMRYSNVHIPSTVNVLSPTGPQNFNKVQLQKETLIFYLLESHEFKHTDFELKQAQASILCRLVTQLKAMAENYPDEVTLNQIIHKRENILFGEKPEPV